MRYRCTVSCNDSTSADCLNEKLVRDVADAMVTGGYKDAGYEYVNLARLQPAHRACPC